jgi:capsular polysaccharide biosynthesis protein
MELRDIWRVIRRWWWLILLPPLVVVAYGLATYRPPGVAYSAAMRFTASQPPGGAATGYSPSYYTWLTSEYIVSGLKDWVRTGEFAGAVSAELAGRGLDVPAAALAGSLNADNARSVLVVYLTWGSADQVVPIFEAVTAVLQNRNAEVFPQLSGQPAVVVPLDTPSPGPVSPSLRARLDLPLKAGLALALGAALALAAHYLDPFLRDRRDLEALGLPVVGELPRER